ncbi:hypothetical protein GUJ93_ZPchr0002g26791 [Zizania palustris]|uniref:Uncharacterized protein n=1 Tax=Zizania palustris TaxID=103762 RepID=A0A8J5VCD8_ZIZPA|nr:hypothetical protein GUJ93_ZPchr0002g26791 [Zizania palustris]
MSIDCHRAFWRDFNWKRLRISMPPCKRLGKYRVESSIQCWNQYTAEFSCGLASFSRSLWTQLMQLPKLKCATHLDGAQLHWSGNAVSLSVRQKARSDVKMRWVLSCFHHDHWPLLLSPPFGCSPARLASWSYPLRYTTRRRRFRTARGLLH